MVKIELNPTATKIFIGSLEKSEAELGCAIRRLAENDASNTSILEN